VYDDDGGLRDRLGALGRRLRRRVDGSHCEKENPCPLHDGIIRRANSEIKSRACLCDCERGDTMAAWIYCGGF
jgi:hypothetical protein